MLTTRVGESSRKILQLVTVGTSEKVTLFFFSTNLRLHLDHSKTYHLNNYLLNLYLCFIFSPSIALL